MNAEVLFLALLGYCIIASPAYLTRRYKRLSQKELTAISSKHTRISWAYWIGAVLVFPLMLGAFFGSLILGASYPQYARAIVVTGLITGFSVIPLYQACFAFLTSVFPINKFGDFVLPPRSQIGSLAIRQIAFILTMVTGTALLLLAVANT